jgi:DNA-binding NtrC family response regulator
VDAELPFEVLVLEDEPVMRRVLARAVRTSEPRARVSEAATEDSARALLRQRAFDLLFLDVRLSSDPEDTAGLDVLDDVRSLGSNAHVTIVSGHSELALVRRAFLSGANGYLEKGAYSPVDLANELAAARLRRAGANRVSPRADRPSVPSCAVDGLIGDGLAMRRLRETIARTARASEPVLILGETGTGKELVARAVHALDRAGHPFLPMNCGALPGPLFESTLFGHVRGSFTGADASRNGMLLDAEGGTVFLDEIGDLPREHQVALLRVVQQRVVLPLGGTREVPFQARILAATHVDLHGRVAEGRFREDLFHQLNVLELRVPSLRERAEDIPLLCDALLAKADPERTKRLSTAALDALMRAPLRGNVRELENLLRRAVLLAGGDVIEVADLRLHPGLASADRGDKLASMFMELPGAHNEKIDALERSVLDRTLRACHDNGTAAARQLGLDRKAFARRSQRLGVPSSRPKR